MNNKSIKGQSVEKIDIKNMDDPHCFHPLRNIPAASGNPDEIRPDDAD
jgi:hypothetical protein